MQNWFTALVIVINTFILCGTETKEVLHFFFLTFTGMSECHIASVMQSCLRSLCAQKCSQKCGDRGSREDMSMRRMSPSFCPLGVYTYEYEENVSFFLPTWCIHL